MGLRTFKNEISPIVELSTKQKTPVGAGVKLLNKENIISKNSHSG